MNTNQHMELLRAQREELRYRGLYYQALHELRKANVGVGRLARKVVHQRKVIEIQREIIKTHDNGYVAGGGRFVKKLSNGEIAATNDFQISNHRYHP